MKAIVASILLVAASFAVSGAVGASAPDRPQGVTAGQWLPINSSLGLVLFNRGDAPNQSAFSLPAPAEGYFMVKVGTSWRRLAVANPERATP